MIDTLAQEVVPGRRYDLTFTALVEGPSDSAPPLLLTCRFSDAEGRPLSALPEGFSPSERYGPHRRVGPPGLSGPMPISLEITAPPDAASVRLRLHPWRARTFAQQAPLRLTPDGPDAGTESQSVPEPTPEPAPNPLRGPDRVLAWRDAPASPGERYELIATFDRPVGVRDLVGAVRFLQTDGSECAPRDGTPYSDQVGSFRYLDPASQVAGLAGPDNQAFTAFTAPPDAARIEVELLRWSAAAPEAASDVVLRAQSDLAVAEGEVAVASDEWSALQFAVTVPNAPSSAIGLMEVQFRDADGLPLFDRVDGIQGSVRFPAFVPIESDDLGRQDGIQAVRPALRPPSGARSLRWRLFPEPGQQDIAPGIAEEPVLAEVPRTLAEWTEALPSTAIALADGTDAASGLAVLAGSDFESSLSARGFTPLAMASALVDANTGWVRFAAELTRSVGPLEAADLVLVPVPLDAQGNTLDMSNLPGLRTVPGLGPHRLVSIDETAPGQARVDTVLPLPANTRQVLALLVARHARPDITVTGPALRPTTADRLFDHLNTASMTRPQLVQSLDIAEAVGDPGARYFLCAALSVVDPETKGYAYRARVAGEALAPLTHGWTPLPDAPGADPVTPGKVLHMASEALASQPTFRDVLRAGSGPEPVLILPLGAEDPAGSIRKDGLAELRQDGLHLVVPSLPGIAPQGLSSVTRIALETRLQDRVLRREGCAMVQVWLQSGDADALIPADALARRRGLPLICAVDWPSASGAVDRSDLAPRRATRFSETLRGAAAVIARSEVHRDALVARHRLDPDLVHVLPPPLATTVTQLAPMGDVMALRSRHGMARGPSLGIEIGTDIDDGLLATLIAALRPAHPEARIVLLGDPDRCGRAVRTLGPDLPESAVVVARPDDVTPLATWLRSLTLFLPNPASSDPDLVTAAVAQNVPVARFSTDAPDLADRIQNALADPATLSSKATQARFEMHAARSPSRLAETLRRLQVDTAARAYSAQKAS